MPKALINKVASEYEHKGKSAKQAEDIAYATMNARGYMHGSKETAKGREAERKYKMHIHGGSDHDVVEMAEAIEVRDVDMHQYAPEYENTSSMRVMKAKKHWDADQMIPNSWDLDDDGESSGGTDSHGA